jgi:hypothetical protein
LIIGIGAGVFGYAIFYWGLHHFPGVDGGQRYSLFTLLGIPTAWGLVKGQPVGLYPGPNLGPMANQGLSGANLQDYQTGENTTTPNNLTGGGGNWIGAILNGLGAPGSNNNVNKLNAWNACEGNLAGHSGLGINNPFNTTLNFGGGTSVNGAGVKSYPTITIGVQATLQTLQAARYTAIVNNLVNDGSFAAFANAVGSSGWGTSGSCIAGKGVPVTTA